MAGAGAARASSWGGGGSTGWCASAASIACCIACSRTSRATALEALSAASAAAWACRTAACKPRRSVLSSWSLFALNAILLFNFLLPHLAGSLDPLWFYASTLAGALLASLLRGVAPGRPGRIRPAWGIAGALLAAWHHGMIAPVPLVKRDMAVGHDFVQTGGRFLLQVERAPWWQFWRDHSATVQVAEGARLYGVTAVFAPLGVAAELEHRWEFREVGGWRQVYRDRFRSTGGRERGFRGYSWVLDPKPGEWRFTVATGDGRTIGILQVQVRRGAPQLESLLEREF